eukprot:12879717-Alexandrium_andersonii.AAC.1
MCIRDSHPQDGQRLGLVHVRTDVAKRIQLDRWPGDPEWDYVSVEATAVTASDGDGDDDECRELQVDPETLQHYGSLRGK